MRCFVLCCLVALAACQDLRYNLNLNPWTTYEYEYEGEMNFGLAVPNVAQSGVRMTCKVKITNGSETSFFLQVSDLAFAEFNGFPGRDSFHRSEKLTQRIAAQFVNPFMFDYSDGHVGCIVSPAGVSDTVVNIVRGILSFIHVTLKTTKTNYDLEEMTIYGKCPSYYSTVTHEETKDMTVTQVVDIAGCKEKAEIYSGMAAAVPDDFTKQRGESVASTVKYVYTVKPEQDGGVITSAHAVEEQVFTPFNVKGGTFTMKATKNIRLLSVTEQTKPPVLSGPTVIKGDIKFKFTNTDVNIPLVMQNLQDPKSKALEELKRLAKANIEKVDSATTEYSIKLYQLLRLLTVEELEDLWKDAIKDEEHRRWFLDTIVEIGDARILKFLETRFKDPNTRLYEAWQTFLMALSHLRASPELVEESKKFLEMPFSKSDRLLWQTVVLSYGSLVYKYCVDRVPCPIDAVQPLNNMAKESLEKGNEADMILALKALGNAGHTGSIKTISRFLPGVSANPVNMNSRVLSAAVQSLRHIAARDPHQVQDITMKVFLKKDLPHEIRMLAFVILFETKPPFGLVSAITAHLMEEKDLHVASFAYSYLRSIARSRTPDNHFLSISCNVAIKILTPKFGHLSYYYSKAMRLDWFHDDFLIGTATDFYMFKRDNFPTEIMMKGKLFSIGRILQLLEMGIYAEGLKELLAGNDFQSYLKNWVNFPNDKVIMSSYSRAFGQEWFYADFTKEYIENLIKCFQSVSMSAGKDSPLWTKIEDFQRKMPWHSTKPLLTFEARYIQATSLGLPVEISKYYHTINGITVNATADIVPRPSTCQDLLTSNISLTTNGFVGFTKDFWVFYGINTELFQYAAEFQAKVIVSVPWSLNAVINIKEKKFKVDFPACAKNIDFFSVSSNVYAISRNAEEPELAKRTPMIPTVVKTNDEINQMMSQRLNIPDCLKSPIYGARLCVESEFRRQYYHEEYPLYYFLGYTRLAVRLVPVPAEMAIHKIQFEVNAVPNRHPEATKGVPSDLKSQQDVKMQVMNSTADVEYNIKAFAMSKERKFRGYEANFHYSPESDMANVTVAEVGGATKWQMFVGASTQGATAKAHIKWGEESKSYEMSMSAEVQEATRPTLNTTMHWTSIPENLAEMGKSIGRYIPGMALLLGFYEKDETGDMQGISASVIAATEDSVDLKIKLTEYSICYRALPLPLLEDFTNATVNSFGPL